MLVYFIIALFVLLPVPSYSFKSFFILGHANSTRQSVVPAGLVNKKNVCSGCLTQGTLWAVGKNPFMQPTDFD